MTYDEAVALEGRVKQRLLAKGYDIEYCNRAIVIGWENGSYTLRVRTLRNPFDTVIVNRTLKEESCKP